MRNPGDKSADRAPGRRRNPAVRGSAGPAQETGGEPAQSGSALFVPGYSGGRDSGSGRPAGGPGQQGAGYPAAPGGTQWGQPGRAPSGWGQGRATATKGPVRGFPPAPGQPPPLYPPGQFSAWNRAPRPVGDASYDDGSYGQDGGWGAGGSRDGGYPASDYGQGGSGSGRPGHERGGDPGYGAETGYADPGYSVLAVSDPAADVTSTQTWAAVDASPFWDDSPDAGPRSPGAGRPPSPGRPGGSDSYHPGNGHPLDRHTAPGHTGWPEGGPDEWPPAGAGEPAGTGEHAGTGQWPAETREWPGEADQWPAGPAGHPAAGHPTSGAGTGGSAPGGVATGGTRWDADQGGWNDSGWTGGEPRRPATGPHGVQQPTGQYQTAGPQTARSHTAGPHTAGPHTAGPQTSGPQTPGQHQTGQRTTGQHTARQQAAQQQAAGYQAAAPEAAGGPAGTVAAERPGQAHTGWPGEPGDGGQPPLGDPGTRGRAGAGSADAGNADAGGAGAGRRWGRRKGSPAGRAGRVSGTAGARADTSGGAVSQTTPPAVADVVAGQRRDGGRQPRDGRGGRTRQRGQDAQREPGSLNGPDSQASPGSLSGRGGQRGPDSQAGPGRQSGPGGQRGPDSQAGWARPSGRDTAPGRVVTGPGQVVGGTGPGPDGTRTDRQSARRAARKRRTRLLVAAGLVVVVLIVAGAAYAVFGRSKPQPGRATGLESPPAGPVTPSVTPSPSPSLGKWGHIATRADDPTALSLRELYPAKATSSGTTYTRTVQKSSTKCTRELIGAKLKAAVHKAGCTQVLRASYLSGSRKVMGTVGVLNLVSVAAAEKAGKASGSRDFIAQLAAAKGPTHHLTKGTGLEETEVKGHYLVIVWAEFANLKKPRTKGQRLALETFCNRVLQSTANQSLASRLVTGKPRTSS